MNNLEIYNKARVVPSEALTPITAGRLKGMSDINPMWRIKRLTEIFGPCGIGWWYEITDKRLAPDSNTMEIAAFVDILLYYKNPESGEVSHGIPGTGGSMFSSKEKSGFHTSDEAFKMALTDAISVAAKPLGVAADVYYAKDRTKYSDVAEEPTRPTRMQEPPKVQDNLLFKCELCGEVLKPYNGADGNMVSVRKHVEGSKAKFGHTYCIGCINEMKKGEQK